MSKIILLAALIILAFSACNSGAADPSQFKGTIMPAEIPAPDFTFTNVDGQEVHLSDYQDKIVLLYFGYIFCPDVCPSSLTDLKLVQNKLDEAGEKIQVIMITVDPDRDLPEKIAEYVGYFHPTFLGLSGTKEEIDAAAEGYGVYYEKHEGTPATGYLVDHTARIFVIEPDGTYRLSFGFGTPVDDIVSDLQLLLREMQS
jgi:protein SCO1/2